MLSRSVLRRSDSRAAGMFHLALAAIVAVVVAVIALRASTAQPPAIAEFAPPAQQLSQESDAAQVDAQDRAFASSYSYHGGGYYYYLELARRGVISVSHIPHFDTPTMTRYRPYLWQYPMATDRLTADVGQWVCARL